MSKIFGLFLSVVLLLQNGCAYKPYGRDDNWVYFEDWDMNSDSKIDSTEFVNGYVRDELFKEDRSRGATSSATAEESAKALFLTCDENKDGVVSGLEFYRWEVDRDGPVKRDSVG